MWQRQERSASHTKRVWEGRKKKKKRKERNKEIKKEREKQQAVHGRRTGVVRKSWC